MNEKERHSVLSVNTKVSTDSVGKFLKKLVLRRWGLLQDNLVLSTGLIKPNYPLSVEANFIIVVSHAMDWPS